MAYVQQFFAPYGSPPSPLPAQVSQPYSESFDMNDTIAIADFARGVEVFAEDGSTPLSSFDEGSAPFTVICDTKHKRACVGCNDPQKGVDVYTYPSETLVTTILEYPGVYVDDRAFGPAPSP